MRGHGCFFDDLIPTILAGIPHLAFLSAGGFLLDGAMIAMSLRLYQFGMGIAAITAGVGDLPLLGTGRRLLGHGVIVTQGLRVIRSVPLTANFTNVLVISFLTTSRSYPNRRSVVVTAAVVYTIQNEGVVTADGHALGIANPADHGIPLLFFYIRKNNDRAVGQDHLGNERHIVGIIEFHDVLAGSRLNDGTCYDIHGRGSGNGIRYAITVNVPAHQHLRFLQPLGQLQIRLTDNLRCHENLTTHEVAVLIVEVRRNPIIPVHHAVSVVPAGVVLVPPDIFFVGFDVNSDAGDILKCIGMHLNIFAEYDGF